MSEHIYWQDDSGLYKREEIVRCRDCKHFTPKGTHKFENGKVNVDYCIYVRGWMLQITPDGFCAWGERRGRMSEYIIRAASIELIVRCCDCIYYTPDPDPIDPGWPMMCERTGDDMVEPYGFCAWAERREVDA